MTIREFGAVLYATLIRDFSYNFYFSYKDQVLGKETSYCERDELCSEREGPDSGEEAKEL